MTASSEFAGTGSLVRLALRRDRVLLPVWLAALVGMAASSASATVGFYPTAAARVEAAEAFNRAQSLVALYGRVYDPTSLGAFSLIKLGGFGAVFVALLAIIVVVRHTRAEEEAGRQELVGATVVGRRAPLSAALIVAAGTNLVLGVLTALGLIAAGLPADGSLAFGVAWAGVGIAFAGVAAVTAQLTSSARTATGLASAVLGLVYVLRAIGDTAGPGGPGWVTWLSPIGWGQQFRPYAGNRWWVLLVTLGFAAVVVAAAYALVARRDLGSGLVPERPGPARAGRALRTPLALAWRLQRGALLGWTAGFVLGGLVVGNIASTVGDFLGGEQAREMIMRLGGEQGLTQAYLAAVLSILGVIASAYGVQAASRLHAEEAGARAEPVLASATSRTAYLAGHTVVALLGTAAVLGTAGLAAGLVYGARVGDLGEVGPVLGGALVQIPAAWVLTGIVVAVFGLAPRLAVAGWAALAAFVLVGEIGPLLRFPQAVMNLSPFAHVPRLPGADLDLTSIAVLTVVAAALLAAGLAGFRRRDVPVS